MLDRLDESQTVGVQAARPQTVSGVTKPAGGAGSPAIGRRGGRPLSGSRSSTSGAQQVPKALPGQLFKMEYSPTRNLLSAEDQRHKSGTTSTAGGSGAGGQRNGGTSVAASGAGEGSTPGGLPGGAIKDRLAGLEDVFASIDHVATLQANAAHARNTATTSATNGQGIVNQQQQASPNGGNKPVAMLNPRFLVDGDDQGGAAHGKNMLQKPAGGTAATGSSASVTKGTATSANTNPMSTQANAGANVRKQRVESYIGPVEKANRKVRRENELLSRVAVLAQENCIDNDSKYEAALQTLRNELEFATVLRQDASETLQTFNKQFSHVQQQIDLLVSTAENSGQAEHDAVRQAFERQLDEQKATLGRVRENGKNTTTEWKRKNEDLQERLISLLDLTDAAYHRHVELTEESMRLRVEFQAQEGDEQLLQDEHAKVNYEHQMLKDKLHSLETEAAAAAATSSTIDQNGGRQGDPAAGSAPLHFTHPLLSGKAASSSGFSPNSTIGGGDDASVDGGKKQLAQQTAQSIRKAQILLETEAANLQAVRSAHVMALRQRTELEVFLRQAILLHKQSVEQQRVVQIADHAPSTGTMSNTHRASMLRLVGMIQSNRHERPSSSNTSPLLMIEDRSDKIVQTKAVQFSPTDRSSVIEAMLSQKRVLQLMYEDESNLEQSNAQQHHVASKTRHLPSQDQQQLRRRSMSKDFSSAIGGVSSGMREEASEIAELYDRWKAWTVEANEAFNTKSQQPEQSATLL